MQGSLFGDGSLECGDIKHKTTFSLNPGTLTVHESFLPQTLADHMLETLMSELNWSQPKLRMHGRWVPVPRMQVWMGDEASSYTYSNQVFKPEPWHPSVKSLKNTITRELGQSFNSVLCNLYRDGQDSVAWHADDEPELNPDAVIASYSLGATRSFQLKPKHDKSSGIRHRYFLPHNSLLVMTSDIQQAWLHQVPKTKKVDHPRINLTFREILGA